MSIRRFGGNRLSLITPSSFYYAARENWIKVVLPIAYDLEHLAPSLANDGPNSEYPWPNSLPQCALVNYIFPVWKLVQSGNGRDLMRVVHIAVDRFPEYA